MSLYFGACNSLITASPYNLISATFNEVAIAIEALLMDIISMIKMVFNAHYRNFLM